MTHKVHKGILHPIAKVHSTHYTGSYKRCIFYSYTKKSAVILSLQNITIVVAEDVICGKTSKGTLQNQKKRLPHQELSTILL